MRYIPNHNYHIHTKISACSNDEEQTVDNIVKYSKLNDIEKVCLTDHYWDKSVYAFEKGFYTEQDYERIKQVLPFKKYDGVKLFFGCETDMDYNNVLGITKEHFDLFDFVVVPTTHLHIKGSTVIGRPENSEVKKLYIERLDKLLDMDIPFEKTGIAHLTCCLIAPGDFQRHIDVLNSITDSEFRYLFDKIKDRGAGVELNFRPNEYEGCLEPMLRPYQIAKEQGCKFYFGSDSHHIEKSLVNAKAIFNEIVDLLKLEETDKFDPLN